MDSEAWLRADTGPVLAGDGVVIVNPDGALGVNDVITILRVAVQLDELDWRERILVLSLEDAAELIAFRASLEGRPRWAQVLSATGACSGDPTAGFDLAGDRLAYTCASDPGIVVGPVVLLELRYRVPSARDLAALALTAEAVDPTLVRFTPSIGLGAP